MYEPVYVVAIVLEPLHFASRLTLFKVEAPNLANDSISTPILLNPVDNYIFSKMNDVTYDSRT